MKSPKTSKIILKVYDITGKEIRTLVDGTSSPGLKSVVWDGRNDRNQPVSSGIYIYRLQAGNQVQSKKMILLE